jgi:diguanylate cyclase (GGDEF)-like protein
MGKVLKILILFVPPTVLAGAVLATTSWSPLSILMVTLSVYCVLTVALWLYHARHHEKLRTQHTECVDRSDNVHRKMRELQGRIDVLTAEREISLVLNESLDFDRIMDRVLTLTGEALSVRDSDSLQLYVKNGHPQPVMIAERSRGTTRRVTIEREDALVGQALSRAGIVVSAEEERVELAAPLTHDRELIGAMKLQLGLRGGVDMRTERVQFLQSNIPELAKFVSLAIKTRDLYSKAVEDALTGLATKRHFLSQLETFAALARRHGEPLSLIMVDIDHFKKVNDSYGHLSGDIVLREVAQVILKNIRHGGDLAHSAYRYGGEELCIILPKTEIEKARQVAERIRTAVGAKIFKSHEGKKLRVTISLGAAQLQPGMTTTQELIAIADAALYEAKHSGRNRVVTA